MTLEKFHSLQYSKQELIISKGIDVFSQFSFVDASTDLITHEAQISKGLLFHYFDSKKNFYLYLLEHSLKLLSQCNTLKKHEESQGFYEILFESMDKKIQLEEKYPREMLFVNLASKETSKQVLAEKQELMNKYMSEVQKNSAIVLSNAIEKLSLRNDVDKKKLVNALSMYINTIVQQYLQVYRNYPQDFYNNSDKIKSEIKDYIDLMLQGVEAK